MKILLVELETHFRYCNYLKAQLKKVFDMEINEYSKVLYVPHTAFNQGKKKWDGVRILSFVKKQFDKTREGKFIVLALFPYDVYADSLNFVYGLGEDNGNYALLSYFRLDERFYGREENESIFKKRLLKETIHEIGHVLGIDHCKNKRCVMSFSPNMLFVDRKATEFCRNCAMLL